MDSRENKAIELLAVVVLIAILFVLLMPEHSHSEEPRAGLSYSLDTPEIDQSKKPEWYVRVLTSKHLKSEQIRVINRLRRAGYPVVIRRTTVDSSPSYKILVGGYGSEDEAKQFRAKLTEYGDGE